MADALANDTRLGAQLTPGTVLEGRYRLEAIVGAGSFGVVWQARHVQLEMDCAIKLFDPPSGADLQDASARFLQEARLMARLKCPHVAQVFDFGVHERMPFLVLELLRGTTLAAHLQQLHERGRRMSPQRTVRILAHVAEALHVAHSARVVHRDLKPENIYLVEEGSSVLAKVLDFGIAKWSAESLLSMTTTRIVMGTPHYMSPEQFESARQVDHRADLWSLAVLAFECLTGTVPFPGNTLIDVAFRVLKQGPLVASQIADVPPGFDRWFARATALGREYRFESAREQVQALAEACSLPAPPLQAAAAIVAPAPKAVAPAPRAIAPAPKAIAPAPKAIAPAPKAVAPAGVTSATAAVLARATPALELSDAAVTTVRGPIPAPAEQERVRTVLPEMDIEITMAENLEPRAPGRTATLAFARAARVLRGSLLSPASAVVQELQHRARGHWPQVALVACRLPASLLSHASALMNEIQQRMQHGSRALWLSVACTVAGTGLWSVVLLSRSEQETAPPQEKLELSPLTHRRQPSLPEVTPPPAPAPKATEPAPEATEPAPDTPKPPEPAPPRSETTEPKGVMSSASARSLAPPRIAKQSKQTPRPAKTAKVAASVPSPPKDSPPPSPPEKTPPPELPSNNEAVTTVNEAAAAALGSAAKLASSCRPSGGPSGSGKARVIFGNDGKVQSVEILTATFRETVTGSCVRMVFLRAKIDPFHGEPPTFIKSFTIPEG